MATLEVLDVRFMGGTTPEARLKSIKSSAKKRNKDCTLTLEHIKKMYNINLNSGTCDYSGTVFSNVPNTDDYPSIDRINPNIGYVPGNVIVCTRRVNNLKNFFFEENRCVKYTKEDKLLIGMIAKTLSTDIKNKALNYVLDSDSVYLDLKLNTLIRRFNNLGHDFQQLPQVKNTIVRKDPAMSLVNSPEKYRISTIPLNQLRKNEETLSVPVPQLSTELTDLDVAKYMVALSGKYNNVVLSFAELQRKLRSKVCQFSSDNIENCVLMVIDSTKPINYHNVFAIDSKYENALSAIIECGFGFKEFGAKLDKMCTDLIIEN